MRGAVCQPERLNAPTSRAEDQARRTRVEPDEEAVCARRARAVGQQLLKLVDHLLVDGQSIEGLESGDRDHPARVRTLCEARKFITFFHRLEEKLLLHLRRLADRTCIFNGARREVQFEPRALEQLFDVGFHLFLLVKQFGLPHLVLGEREIQLNSSVSFTDL